MLAFWKILFAILLLLGLWGTIFLPFPGILFMFAAVVVFSVLIFHFPMWALVTLALLTLISIVIDNLFGFAGMKWSGVSKRTALFGLVALFIGTLFFPPFGGIVCLFMTVLALEITSEARENRELSSFGSAATAALSVFAAKLTNIVVGGVFVMICLFLLIS